ncbi:hypothetical protein N7540_006962 [Penicillium herquei]|nr:hypothetical protein N7540_006962 [Penicillium herquei]
MATAVYTQSQTISLELEVQNSSSHITLEGSQISASEQESEIRDAEDLSRVRAFILVATLTGITFVGSMSGGLLTVCLPGIAKDLNLPDNLLLWPSSVYSLANGCCLLLAGSLADFLGNRSINLVGCFLLAGFILACGVAETGIQLIMFRTCQGIATSMCLPTAFSILTDSMSTGKRRNIGFACLGLGQPLGFSVGLVLGGIFQDSSLGWRFGYYLCAGATFILTIVNFFKLPADRPRECFSLSRLRTEIDWVGIVLSSSCLGIVSYVFSWVKPLTTEFLKSQAYKLQKHHRSPEEYPKRLKYRFAFSSGCNDPIILGLDGVARKVRKTSIDSQFVVEESSLYHDMCNGFLLMGCPEWHGNHFESFAALRFLPNVIIGIIINIGTGLLIHRLRANYIVLVTSILSAGSPLLMALIDPKWSWWYDIFWVMLLGPVSADAIFTVANLIIADSFSPKTQGLAGAVFNTVAQFGTSIGLSVFAIISASVTDGSHYKNKSSPAALMVGYRAVFWACFGLLLAATGISAWGLRRVGKVGIKRE